jgi:hypothetical protein
MRKDFMKQQERPKKSTRALKFDKHFTPCPVVDGDEIFQNGFFDFNITKMIEFIRAQPNTFATEEVSVDDFPREFSSINEEHMEKVQIAEPVILAEIAPGRYNLLDGNHRMDKARRLGIERIRAYRLSVEHHIRFLTSTKAYKAYVEYWNSKL